jgi:hypothetical protein
MGWKDWVPTLGIVGIVAVAIVWSNRGNGPGSSSPSGEPANENPRPAPGPDDRTPRCRGLVGSPQDRVQACFADLERSSLSDAARSSLEGLAKKGKLAVAARGELPGEQLDLGASPELLAAALATDEAAFAALLRDAGVRGLVVSRDFTQALDRDRVVLARLAHHDHLEWFQLRYVTADLMVYSVRSSPARLPIDTADQLLRGLRQRLTRIATGSAQVEPQRWEPEAVRLIGSLRTSGATLASRHVVAGGEGQGRKVLEGALDELADKLYREWERKVETQGHGHLSGRLDDVRLEIQVVLERAPVEPRTRYALFDLLEMGVDGMMFRQREEKGLDEKFTYLPGSELVTRSLHSIDEFLRAAVAENDWRDLRPWEKDDRTRLDLFRAQHFMEATPGGGPAVRLVRGAPEVPLDGMTDRRVQDMLVAGGEWWLANQFADGSFEYKYWPEQNRRSTEYNEVRHILGIRDLADTWRYRNDQRYLDGSRRAMDWLLQYTVYDTDPPVGPLPHVPAGGLLFRYPSYAEQARGKGVANQKLGTVAVGLLGWLQWARATGSHEEDERIRKMAKFVMDMQEEDGRFRPYLVHPGHSYEDDRNDIVPGEAMLALGEVAEYFGEKEWVAPYDKFVSYYQPWFRERSQRKLPSGRWPHDTYDDLDRLDMVQFGPWSVMAAKQVHKITGDPRAVEFGLEVADWMIDNYQWTGERSPWPDYVGGYYKLPEELPAMQTFCYSEGTAAAYTLAMRAKDPRKDKYELATKEAIRFLDVMQFDDLDAYWVTRPIKVRGGIKYTMNEQKIRIDYVGHGLSTLTQWLDARAEDPAVTEALHDPADLTRPAGTWNSVPGLDYSGLPMLPLTGEVPGGAGAGPKFDAGEGS